MSEVMKMKITEFESWVDSLPDRSGDPSFVMVSVLNDKSDVYYLTTDELVHALGTWRGISLEVTS